jgi:hypothetical protein
MKEQYHTYKNENRRAEIFLTPSRSWLVECFEDDKNVQQSIVATEPRAELLADNWVFKVNN